MKTIKFKDFKAKMILSGEKFSSMRLFDDKDLQAGDDLDLINSDNKEIFAKAKITEVIDKKMKDVNDQDLIGHEKFTSQDEMLMTFRKYYGDNVDLDTPVKIVRFKLG